MENTTKAEKMEKKVGRCDDITYKDGTSTCSSKLVIKIEKDEQIIQRQSPVNQLDHGATKLTTGKEEIVSQTEPDESDLINDILSVLQNSSGDYDAPGCLVIQPKIDAESSQIEDVVVNGLPGSKPENEQDERMENDDTGQELPLEDVDMLDMFPHIKEDEIKPDAIKKEEDSNETSIGIKRKIDESKITDISSSSPAKRPAYNHTGDDKDSNISTSLSSVTSRNGVTAKNATVHKSTSNTSSVSKSSWIVKGVKDVTKSGTSKVNFKSKINASHFCSVCKKVFANSRLLAEHISTKHGSTRSTCKICGKSFVDATYLAKHMSLNHNPNSAVKYTCTLCLEVSYTLPDYKAHMAKHYKETPPGNYGKEMSVNSNELKSENNNCASGDEQTESSQEKSFFCVVCRYVSRGLASYVKHLEQHNNITDAAVQSFECSHCGMLFGNKGSLANHSKVHDVKGESLIEYDCGFCDETFATQRQLSDHLQVHTGSNLPMKPHVCSTCGKAFAKKCVLWIHEKIHSEPQYECQVCNKKFTTRTQRINHERVHNGQRPYACSVCAKRFKTMDAVNNHELTHSDARPCKCVICGKGFRRKDHLNRHLQTHSGAQERPFPCNLCENRFQDKHRLNLHLKAHEKGKTRRPRKLKNNNTDATTAKSKSKGRKKRRRKNENSDDTSDDDLEHSDESNSPSRSTETSGDKLRNDESRSYSCKTCHMTFKRESALKAHNKTHDDDDDSEHDDSDLDDSELDD